MEEVPLPSLSRMLLLTVKRKRNLKKKICSPLLVVCCFLSGRFLSNLYFLFVGPDLLGVGQYYVLLEAGNSFPSIQFTAISYKCMKLFLAYLLIYPAFEVVYFFAKKKIFILTLNNALFVS